jgi:GNAT superfamily N-acetyltransferase
MTAEAVRIRPVDFRLEDDVDRFVTMLDAYARDPMGMGTPLPADVPARLRRDLAAHPGAFALLAEAAGDPVGFATCFVGYSTFRAMPLLNIHDIAVIPAWRGRGVAGHLLDAITQYARGLGCCRVTLEVRSDNAPARALYRRAGFLPAGCDLFLEQPLA